MVESANPISYGLAILFVSGVTLFGLFSMFAQPSNIERTALVGGLTTLTALISIWMLAVLPPVAQTGPTLTSISLVSLVGYALGRFIDYVLGPKPLSQTPRAGELAD